MKKLAIIFLLSLFLLLPACYASLPEPMQTWTENGDEYPDRGDIEEFYVAITGIKRGKDYQGKPVVIVTYEWTNKSPNAVSWDAAINARAYQGGISLNEALLEEDDEIEEYKYVKPGITQTLKIAYKIRNDSEIEVEVEGYYSEYDKVAKTFDLPSGTENLTIRNTWG
ncbi:MAG: DUF5067 domain-containing protein [Oscillospiraceae bacterium]|nr:DUF5067 domain-containing protein [Oscillospiraceae bacterium]